MQNFDIEQSPWRPNTVDSTLADNHHQSARSTSKTIHWQTGGRFIALKRFSAAIVLIETATIVVLVYLLMRLPPDSGGDLKTSSNSIQHGNISISNQAYRTYYSKRLDSSVVILPGLVPNCNQRRHDLKFSVQCKSNQIELCRSPLPTSGAGKLATDGGQGYVEIFETSMGGARMDRRRQYLKEVRCRMTTTTLSDDGGEQLAATSNNPADMFRCRFGTRLELDLSHGGHQKIIGWGGALTDSSINNILSLSVNGTRRLLDDYFGPDGLMFNMVRVTIGGSDFSARFYTNNDAEPPPKDDDVGRLSKEFELKEEDYLYKIPLLKMVQDEYGQLSGRPIKLFASMWSPPTWMKTNRHFNKGQLRGSIDDEPLVDPRKVPRAELFYDALSELKLKWLQSYRAQSIEFWGLTVMNEPVFAVQPFLNFNTMIFPRDDYANYVAKYLGPKLKRNDKLKHIKLMVHDDNRRFLMNFTKPILDEHRVRQFVDGVSVHGYVDEEYEMMELMYENYKDIDGVPPPSPSSSATQTEADERQADHWFVLPTELSSGHLPFMEKALAGNWHRGVHYALDVIRSLRHSAAGWVDWNMVLDTEGGPGWLGGRLDAPIIVDKARDLYHKSPMFYVLGQFSRFIPPGSQRVRQRLVNGRYDNQLEVVTFRLPAGDELRQQLATVVVNNNPYPVEILLGGSGGTLELPNATDRLYRLLECPADSVITLLH
jgi:glucosylceramidase